MAALADTENSVRRQRAKQTFDMLTKLRAFIQNDINNPSRQGYMSPNTVHKYVSTLAAIERLEDKLHKLMRQPYVPMALQPQMNPPRPIIKPLKDHYRNTKRKRA